MDSILSHYKAEMERNTSLHQSLKESFLSEVSQSGLPTRKFESWRYVPTKSLCNAAFSKTKTPPSIATQSKLASLKERFPRSGFIVIHNGQWDETLSSPPKECTLLLESREEISLPEKIHLHPFLKLNTIAIDKILSITLSKSSDEPLFFIAINDTLMTHAIRTEWKIKNGISVKVVEYHFGTDEQAYFANIASSFDLENQASLQHYKIQDHGKQGDAADFCLLSLNEESRFISTKIDLGGKTIRSDIDATLQGDKARCELNGLYLSEGKQFHDNHLQINHKHSNTYSNQFYKGITKDESHSVFNGGVYIIKGLRNIEGTQLNNNILLSNKAEVSSKPELEIYSDDVQCAHGATVGQFDDEALFYLQSRGISINDAQSILQSAYTHEILATIQDKSILHWIKEELLSD